MKNIAFLLHGTAKKADRLRNRIPEVFDGHFDYTLFSTERTGHTITLAKEAVDMGYTHIIIAGGDGSNNEMANGVISAFRSDKMPNAASGENLDLEGLSGIRVGLLPAGSGNDFAKTIGVGDDLQQLKQWIETDSHRMIDVGWVECEAPEGGRHDRYYMNITDTGMGGVVAQRLGTGWKWLGSDLRYAKAIVTTFLTYKKKGNQMFFRRFFLGRSGYEH